MRAFIVFADGDGVHIEHFQCELTNEQFDTICLTRKNGEIKGYIQRYVPNPLDDGHNTIIDSYHGILTDVLLLDLKDFTTFVGTGNRYYVVNPDTGYNYDVAILITNCVIKRDKLKNKLNSYNNKFAYTPLETPKFPTKIGNIEDANWFIHAVLGRTDN